jgi:eukaryotic-like serine/threonine-protein kinase
VSPDGRSIVYTVIGTHKDVCIYDLRRGAMNILTKEGRANFAIWSVDGKRVVYGWSNSGSPSLFVQPVDQSAAPEALTTDKQSSGQGPGSWSPDGNLLAFWRQFPDRTQQILTLNRTTGAVTTIVQGPLTDRPYHPEFSPDGRWLAYTSAESGRREVLVRAFPQGGTWQISAAGGTEPLWAKDGKRLFYRSNGGVWVVDIHTSPTFVPGTPHLLFAHADKYFSSAPTRGWDLSADGRRFLMVRLEDVKPQPVTELVLIQNWFEELKAQVPTRR